MECRNIDVDLKRPTYGPSGVDEVQGSERKKKIIIRYKECQKNHAAAIGGNARDGCGEFMASGEEGSPESLTCSACNCHRNFHRKHLEPQDSADTCVHQFIKPVSCRHISEDDEKEERVMRKRVRTKFSEEQKEKMVRFAEKVGWRIQKVEEAVVQQFCQEVGIKRRVLKVWMHNNKNTLAKRLTSSPISTS